MDTKAQLNAMEQAFIQLMETPDAKAPIQVLEESLKALFKYDFQVSVVDTPDWFVMSTYPESSTMETIIKAITNGEKDGVIEKLWTKNKKWTIEIDKKVLGPQARCTEKELVAIVLHEIGHVVLSNKATSRIINIMRYEVAKSSVADKVTMRDRAFRGIMSLPILSACITGGKNGNLKEEIKADKFVKKMGYQQYLVTALNKLSKLKISSPDDMVKTASAFTADTIRNFNARKDALTENRFNSIMTRHFSPTIRSAVESSYNEIFGTVVIETSMPNGFTVPKFKQLESIHDRLDKLTEDTLFNERPDFLKKKLKKIDAATIDYLEVQSQSMKTNDDKLLVISYARHTLDLVNYYISIYHSSKHSRKYLVDNTEAELISFKHRLERIIAFAINYKIPEFNPNLIVQWPAGYDG